MTDIIHDAFTTELHRLHSLESDLVSALQILATDVSIDALDDLRLTECRERLRDRIETHRDETETHLERLEAAFDAVGEDPADRDVPTPELDGWIADKEQFNNIVLNDELRPLYYLAATTKLEEIERSAYEPAIALAQRLETEGDVAGIVDPLEKNSAEEEEMLADLESIADSDTVETLLEESQVDSGNRSALDRSRTRTQTINVETLEDLFVYQLLNAYDVEKRLVEFFDEIATDTDRDDLGETFADHGERVRTHVDRLEDVFDALGPRPMTSQNRTLDGLFEARRNRLESANGEPTEFVDLEIAVALARFESSCYEELLTLAERVGYSDDVVDSLTATLDEEREMVRTLEGMTFADVVEELQAGMAE